MIALFANIVIGVDEFGAAAATSLAKQLAAPTATITSVHIHGSPVGSALHEVALRRGSDLLVVGASHRGAVGRVLLGDPARSTLNGSPCPIAIAPLGYQSQGQLMKLGVGYDGTHQSLAALRAAQRLACDLKGRVSALCVVSAHDSRYGQPDRGKWPEAALALTDRSTAAAQALGDLDGDVSYGEPGPELVRFGRDLDLLVVGTRLRGPLERLSERSVAQHLAHHAPCPVVVIPERLEDLRLVRSTRSRPASRRRRPARVPQLGGERAP